MEIDKSGLSNQENLPYSHVLDILFEKLDIIPLFTKRKKEYSYPYGTLLRFIKDDVKSVELLGRARKMRRSTDSGAIERFRDEISAFVRHYKDYFCKILASETLDQISLQEILDHFKNSPYFAVSVEHSQETKDVNLPKVDNIEKQYNSYKLDILYGKSRYNHIVLNVGLGVYWQLRLGSSAYQIQYNVNHLDIMLLIVQALQHSDHYQVSRFDYESTFQKSFPNYDIQDFRALCNLEFLPEKQRISKCLSKFGCVNVTDKFPEFYRLPKMHKQFWSIFLSNAGAERSNQGFLWDKNTWQIYANLDNLLDKLEFIADQFGIVLYLLQDYKTTEIFKTAHSDSTFFVGNRPITCYVCVQDDSCHLLSFKNRTVFLGNKVCIGQLPKFDQFADKQPPFIPSLQDATKNFLQVFDAKTGEYKNDGGKNFLIPGIYYAPDALLVYGQSLKNLYYAENDDEGTMIINRKQQFQDAYHLLAKGPKKSHNLYSLDKCLNFLCLSDIFSVILENEKDGFYQQGIFALINNHKKHQINLQHLNALTSRYSESITGYENSPFDRIFHVDDVYSNEMDKVTEQVFGYKIEKLFIISKEYIYEQNLVPKNVVLILATLFDGSNYDNIVQKRISLTETHVTQHGNGYTCVKDLFKELSTINVHYQTVLQLKKSKYQTKNQQIYAEMVVLENLFDFLTLHLLQHGPLIMKNSVCEISNQKRFETEEFSIEWKIFGECFQIYRDWCAKKIATVDDCKKILRATLLKGIFGLEVFMEKMLLIKKKDWDKFIDILRAKYMERIRKKIGRFQVPCYVRISDKYHVCYNQIGVLQSYSINQDIWNICIDQKIIQLSFHSFVILHKERYLPAGVRFLTKSHQILPREHRQKFYEISRNSQVNAIPDYIQHGVAVEKLAEKLGQSFFRITVEGFEQNFILEYGVDFVWENPIYIAKKKFEKKMHENKEAIQVKIVPEEPFDKKTKDRVYLYTELYDDAMPPNQNDRLRDPMIWHFFHNENWQFSKFLQFLDISMTNRQLYNVYFETRKIMQKPEFVLTNPTAIVSFIIEACCLVFVQIGWRLVHYDFNKLATIQAIQNHNSDYEIIVNILCQAYPDPPDGCDIAFICKNVLNHLIHTTFQISDQQSIYSLANNTCDDAQDDCFDDLRPNNSGNSNPGSNTRLDLSNSSSVTNKKRKNNDLVCAQDYHSKNQMEFQIDFDHNKFFNVLLGSLYYANPNEISADEMIWIEAIISSFWEDDCITNPYQFREDMLHQLVKFPQNFIRLGSYQIIRLYKMIMANYAKAKCKIKSKEAIFNYDKDLKPKLLQIEESPIYDFQKKFAPKKSDMLEILQTANMGQFVNRSNLVRDLFLSFFGQWITLPNGAFHRGCCLYLLYFFQRFTRSECICEK